MMWHRLSVLSALTLLNPGAAGAANNLVGPIPVVNAPSHNTLRKMSPDELHTLLALQEENRKQVAALTANFPDLTGAERDAVERQVLQIKADGERTFLRAQAQLIIRTLNTNALYNVDAASGYPGFWDSPVVPRNYAGGDINNVHVSAILDGNTNDTYLNSIMWQNGPDPTPSWIWRLTLDSEVLSDTATPDRMAVGGYAFLDAGPILIRGGRHTLGHIADPANLLPESNESDNAYLGQWVWSPLVVGKGVGVVRPVPPDRSLFPNPSGDGFQLTRDVNFSWVIAEAPRSYSDDYDLYVYDDYSGSTSGFSNLLKSSLYSNDATDFVVGHFLATPVTLYAQTVRYTKGNGNDFVYDQIDATNRSVSIGNFQNQVLGANRVADVYEAHLVGGTTYHFILNSYTAGADLGLNLYPPASGGIYSRADAMSVPGADIGQAVGITSDVIESYTASADGYYPVVVYRQRGDHADTPFTYSLTWKAGVVGVASEQESAPRLSFAGAMPNPVHANTVFAFSLPKTASVRLALYDLNGRLVREIANETREAGPQRVQWDGTGNDGSRVKDGIYFARMEALGQVLSHKVVVIR
jgi:flagellar hook capping protein FlgD